MRDWQFNFDFKPNLKGGKRDPIEAFMESEPLHPDPATFDNALDMAARLDLDKDYYAFLSGRFIFGDLFEALVADHELRPSCVWLTTLGLNENNIDSIVNLTELGAERVKLIISRYFAGVERHRLIPYMEKEFKGRPIDVACASIHAKIGIIESERTSLIVCGSANLSSSDSIEQIQLMHDKRLIEYNKRVLQRIFDRWTIYRGETGERMFENRNKRTRDLYEEIKTVEREE